MRGFRTLAGALLLAAGVGRAQEPVSVVPATLPRGFALQRPSSADAGSRGVAVLGQPFTYALRVETKQRPTNPWNIQLNVKTVAPVQAGDRLHATFWLRRVSPTDGEAFTTFIFEKAGGDYRKSAQRTFAEATGEWRRFRMAFEAAESYGPGEAQVNFQLGYAPQTIELGPVTVTNYFRSVDLGDLPDDQTYSGREPDAPWRAAAAARINQLRRADLTVRVLDADGQPVPGAQVEVRMQRHLFGFGAAVSGRWLLGTDGDAARYRGVVSRWFNRVVIENDLKWPRYEQNPQLARDAVAWLRSRDIAVRGHNLIWPSWRHLPADVADLAGDPAALRARINAHLDEEATDFAGQLQDWDVINEPYTEHDVQDVLGQGEMAAWFRRVKAADPQARLFLNDFGNLEQVGLGTAHQEGTYAIIADLLSRGAPLEGIGLQGHFGGYLSSPMQCLAIFDRFAEFARPLVVTEFDVNTLNETIQAEYTRDFLTAAFSHPAVDGVLTWGFWEGAHWRPDAAMFRRNWDLKPNGLAWSNQVFHVWWTDTSRRADATGRVTVRPFKGRHLVRALRGATEAVATIDLAEARELTLTLPLHRVTLNASPTADGILLSWPATADQPELLETALTLEPAAWTPLDLSPTRAGDRWELRLSGSDSTRYFRLSPP